MLRLSVRWRKGFTLVELLVALAIIGLGLAGVFGLFPLGLRSTRLAGDLTTVALIGREATDQIIAAAATYDADDSGFTSRDYDGSGYFDLPQQRVHVYINPQTVSFPEEGPGPISQKWKLTAEDADTMNVESSDSGLQVNEVDFSEENPFSYTSDNDEITFIIKRGGGETLSKGETIFLDVRVVNRKPYYWTSYRSDYILPHSGEAAPETEMQRVTVVVAWGWPGEPRTESFSTLIANTSPPIE